MTLIDLAIACLTGKMACEITPLPIVEPDTAVVYICAPAYDAYTGKADRIARFEHDGIKITAVLNCPAKGMKHGF